jgi:hypothetical protein
LLFNIFYFFGNTQGNKAIAISAIAIGIVLIVLSVNQLKKLRKESDKNDSKINREEVQHDRKTLSKK